MTTIMTMIMTMIMATIGILLSQCALVSTKPIGPHSPWTLGTMSHPQQIVLLIDSCSSPEHRVRMRAASLQIVVEAQEAASSSPPGRVKVALLSYSSIMPAALALETARGGGGEAALEAIVSVLHPLSDEWSVLRARIEDATADDESSLELGDGEKRVCGSVVRTLHAIEKVARLDFSKDAPHTREGNTVGESSVGGTLALSAADGTMLIVLSGTHKTTKPWERRGKHEDNETLQFWRTTSFPALHASTSLPTHPDIVLRSEDAALALLSMQMRAAIFVDHESPGIALYIGNPQFADMFADYSHFNLGMTLVRLDRNGYANALQTLALGQDLDVRVYHHNAMGKRLCLHHLLTDHAPSFRAPFPENACSRADSVAKSAMCDVPSQRCIPSRGCVDEQELALTAALELIDSSARSLEDEALHTSKTAGVRSTFGENENEVIGIHPHHRTESMHASHGSEEYRSGFFDSTGSPLSTATDSSMPFGALWNISVPAIRTMPYQRDPSASWTRDHLVKRDVTVWQWNEHDEFSELAKNRQLPVIVRGSSVCKWAALRNICTDRSSNSRWTADYLRESIGIDQMTNVKGSHGTLFTNLDPASDMRGDRFPRTNWSTEYTIRNMSVAAFFDAVSGSDGNGNSEKLYYFGDMPPALKQDVHPGNMLYLTASDLHRRHQFLWISSPGVDMHTHIDMDHNFFVQITGRKRFTLVPPHNHDRMYCFPRLHPLWHKSQVHFDNPDLHVYPEYRRVDAIVADLQPGDVLYVPPMWWHHVEAIDFSVSLSTWSNGVEAYQAMWAAYGYHHKFEAMSDRRGRMYALRMYLDFLTRRLFGAGRTHLVIRRLIRTRYEGVRQQFLVSQSDAELCGEHIPSAVHVLEDSHFDADIVAAHFQKLSPELRDLLYMDFVEQLVWTAVGTPKAYAFLRHCFEPKQSYVLAKDQGADLFQQRIHDF